MQRYEKLPLCLLIAVAAFIGIFLFTDWGLLATREAWQTAIGLAAVFFVGMLTHYLYSVKEDYGAIGAALSVASAFGCLVWLFNGVDTTVSAILAVGTAILSVVFSYLAFEDVEEGCGWWMALLGVGNFANLIFVLIRFSYFVNSELWQVIIAEAIVIAVCIFVHDLIDTSDYSSVLVLSAMGFAIVGFTLWIFGGYAAQLVSVLSLGLILIDVVCAIKAIDDYETGVGVGGIIFGVMQAGMFALTHICYV